MFNLSEKIWGNDWFIGLAVSVTVLLIAQFNGLQPLETSIYDWSVYYSHRPAGDRIAVIAIDDNSLTQRGDLPWPRTVHAQMIDLLAPYSTVIGNTLDFSQPQLAIKPTYLDDLMTFYNHSKPLNSLPDQVEELSMFLESLSKTRNHKQMTELLGDLPDALTTLDEKIQTAAQVFDSDQQFVASLANANKVILGMPVKLSKLTNQTSQLPHYLLKHQLNLVAEPFDNQYSLPQLRRGTDWLPPLADFANAAQSVSVLLRETTDSRQIPLIIRCNNRYFATLPLSLAAASRQLALTDIKIMSGKSIQLGSLRVPTDRQLQIRPFFYREGFIVDSYAEVLAGRIPAEKYRDKIVLIGITASRYSQLQATPVGQLPTVLVVAHTLASLLNYDFLTTPEWAIGIHSLAWLFVVAYLSGLLPYLKWRVAVASSAGLIISFIVATFLLINHGLAVQFVLQIILVPCGHLALFAKRAIVAYQDAFRLHPDAVESNRLLGLAFQGQGQLDMAFEKFRLCPPDEAIMGLLYNLALDYEMKRHYRGAAAVYHYLSDQNANFRDIEKRLERLHRLKRIPPQGHHFLNGWLLEDSIDKPTLGRYQIEKQIGKGAMGIVYLGNDPKLNRLVAIKTLPLSQEFDDEELHEATTRFFREAAAAGRLTHPNIISIYDAGEEHDLAYISMEYFKGGNLVPYTRPDNLLPIAMVNKIISSIAEALHYAHQQGVIHRDIKPANIMYNPANSKIKITDFGIARITDSNKTKTGIILGTPSYMSPEQLAGKQVDGRTDLFSLGVMLYQLLTGVLPFQGDSMATLMFKIANEPHQDITSVRSDIPPCLKHIVDTALQKDVKERYQDGMQFAQALQECVRPSGNEPTLRDNSSHFERNLICV